MVGLYECGNKLLGFSKGGQLLDSQAMALELLLAESLPDLLSVFPNFTNLLPQYVFTLRHL